MNEQHTIWASSHDWYEGAYLYKGVWVIVVRHDIEPNGTLEFECFDNLKIWAGY